MYREIWVITAANPSGKLYQITYNTQEEAEKRADKLMEREAKDGKKRDFIINHYIVKD